MAANKEMKINEAVSESNMKNITGGGYIGIYYDETWMTTKRHNSAYTSVKEPKYCVGQKLKISYNTSHTMNMCDCEVLSVSRKADCGILFKEHGYSVICTGAPENVLAIENVVGVIYNDVYECCLYEK